MPLNPIVLSIPIFFLLIGIEVIYDRIKHKNLYRFNDAVTNISCGIFEQITGVFAKVITVAMYDTLYENFRIFTVPEKWYWLVILFMGVDLCYYWAHRLSHQINILWLGHVVHHQSEEYNLSVALRQGAIQKVFTAFFYLPLALLGFNTYWFLLLAAFNTLYQFWIHTEAIGRMGFLEWFMNTPSHHRVHHGRNPKYIDRNHAGVFIIWDRMFGTFQKEEEHPVYGITTPVQTWDAVTAHVRPFQNLWSDWTMIKEWKYRLKLLFMKPGWLPEKYGGYRAPKQVFPDTYQKFETKLSKEMNWYLLVHFIFILAGTSLFLFSLSKFSIPEQVAMISLITISIMTTGFLFEGKSWALQAEAIRLFIVVSLLLYILKDQNAFATIVTILAIVIVVSLYWLLRYYPTASVKTAVH